MDDSFFSAELLGEFELADAEYCYDDEMEVDIAQCQGVQLSKSESDVEELEDDADVHVQANLSVREVDEAESTLVDGFMVKGCGCTLGPSKSPCSKPFSREEISSTRINCQEMSTTELDMLVVANLDAHCQIHSREIGEASGRADQPIPTPLSI